MVEPPDIGRRAFLSPLVVGAAGLLGGHASLDAQTTGAADEPLFVGIMQIAYIVPDLRQAIDEWTTRMRVGPWSITDHFRGRDLLYHGQPTSVDITIAMSYSGQLNVELIQQLNDAPSVYRDAIARRGYGFHHWGIATRDFERDLDRHRARGDTIAFTSTAPRIAYIDSGASLPGMVELIEVNDGVRAAFGRMYRRSLAWDGKDAIVR